MTDDEIADFFFSLRRPGDEGEISFLESLVEQWREALLDSFIDDAFGRRGQVMLEIVEPGKDAITVLRNLDEVTKRVAERGVELRVLNAILNRGGSAVLEPVSDEELWRWNGPIGLGTGASGSWRQDRAEAYLPADRDENLPGLPRRTSTITAPKSSSLCPDRRLNPCPSFFQGAVTIWAASLSR